MLVKRVFAALTALSFVLAPASSFGQAGVSVEDRAGGESRFSGGFNRWSYSYFGATSMGQRQLEDTDGASIDVYNYIGINYRTSPSTRFAVRPSFNLVSGGSNKYGDILVAGGRMGDTTLVYSNYDGFTVFGQRFSGSFKYVLPTSEYAQQIRQVGRVKVDLYTDLFYAGPWRMTYAFKPEYYIMSETVIIDPYAKKFEDGSFQRDPRKGTKLFNLDHGVSIDYRVRRAIEVRTYLGFSEDWYNGSVKEQIEPGHMTYFASSIGLDWRPRRGLTFGTSFSNSMRVKSGPVTHGRPEDNTLGFTMNASL